MVVPVVWCDAMGRGAGADVGVCAMTGFERLAAALLVVIAVEGAYSAWQIRRIAREGFGVELTLEQANTLAQGVREAKEQAERDMDGE